MAIDDGRQAAAKQDSITAASALLIAFITPGKVIAWFSDTFQSRDRMSDAPSGLFSQIVFATIFWVCLGTLAWQALRR